ncbi:hypothetical protein P8935_07230 [Telmatobacter sp. DSM 110680]|uniref:Uracil DNA glycosylase superfamily protein n=1 Tax=Telmatobacter sp. DSM 110680 TaxID=3036704 RepID=A0AAU7DMU1_9BACT
MIAEIEAMARGFYGYGRWDAPYWFIGPEQGGDNNEIRGKAFLKLEKDGLCDCEEFHKEIREFKWHRESPALQPTWRRLILLLKAFRNDFSTEELSDEETLRGSLRDYQRDYWGMNDAETCVIELSGLSAKNAKTGATYEPIKEKYLKERIGTIHTKIHRQEFKPKIVIMYGFGEKEHWPKIAGVPFVRHLVEKRGPTTFAFAEHPSARYQEDSYWVELGKRLRKESERP